MSFKLLDKEHSRDRDLELRKKKKNTLKKEEKIMIQHSTRYKL